VEHFDVLVVGGGPAGSTLAYYLSGSGLKIAIMDKVDFPRQKVCAGWVTPAVMQELNIDLEDYARGRELQAIHGFRISQLIRVSRSATAFAGSSLMIIYCAVAAPD